MKLTIAELRLLLQLKQLVEQGLLSQAAELFLSMKDVWDKLNQIKEVPNGNQRNTAS